MNTEDPIFNDGRQTQVVKDLGAVTPDIDRTVFLEALIVESIDLSDLSAFVVTTNQRDTIGISHL
jgi:hypothetical protein